MNTCKDNIIDWECQNANSDPTYTHGQCQVGVSWYIVGGNSKKHLDFRNAASTKIRKMSKTDLKRDDIH